MNHDIANLRFEYEAQGLHEAELNSNPYNQFHLWFQAALNMDIDLANAVVLATADSKGRPTARYVLLKEYNEQGFVFYTSSLSRKGKHLAENPQAALVLYWREMHRQIRVEGSVEQLSASISDKYFQSRPRGSQISAWVATQSDTVPDREFMLKRVDELTKQYEGSPVPRPSNWNGYRLKPELIEFWQGQENRLHDRIQYQRDEQGEWNISRLAP